MLLSTGTLLEIGFLSAFVICGFAVLNLKQIRKLKELGLHFSGSLALYSLFLPSIKGIYEGIRFNVHAGPRFMEVPGTLVIRLLLPPLVEFRIFRKSMMGKAVSKAMLIRGVKTGDALLDAEYAIFAGQAETLKSFLQPAAARRGLQTVFGLGFWMLVADKRGARVEKLAYDRTLDLEPTRIATVLHCLKTMATGG